MDYGKFNEGMSSDWEFRPNQENGDYFARLVKNESRISTEYGEKTWTTAQTVRDLMQNFLDAETEKYYKLISTRFVEPETLLQLKKSELEPETAERLQQFLYGIHMYCKHNGDMASDARMKSLDYLQVKSVGLPLKNGVTGELFEPDNFAKYTEGLIEEVPRVSFRVTDKVTGESLGWKPYEELRDEPMFQELNGASFRYTIEGVKISDHGSGYDSQLSWVFVSSKTDKKHTRGKFGEGAKMSELHLLRGGAKVKMRSSYVVQNKENKAQHRTWQARVNTNIKNRFISEGVEVMRAGTGETGSSVIIDLSSAKENFRVELCKNIDPRLGGLSKNIVDYAEKQMVYPIPISDEDSTGVDTQGNPETQYVQGIRVELASDSFGYSKPWFSYDFQDSSIIAGRDRNEIKGSIVDKIKSFWTANDRLDLLRELVRISVQDRTRGRHSPELEFLNNVLEDENWSFRELDRESEFKQIRLPRLIATADNALIEYLKLDPNKTTIILPPDFEDYQDRWVLRQYITSHGYEVKNTPHDLSSGIGGFQKRHKDTYNIVTINDIRTEINRVRRLGEEMVQEFAEGEKEKKIRKIFAEAQKSVNTFIEALGLDTLGDLEIEFVNPYESGFSELDRKEIDVRYGSVLMDSGRLWFNSMEQESRFQKRIELYLLARYDFDSDPMKSSQHFLDHQITRLFAAKTPLVAELPEITDHIKDPNLAERIVRQITESLYEGKVKEKIRNYELRQKVLTRSISLGETIQALSEQNPDKIDFTTQRNLQNQFFVEENRLIYFDQNRWVDVKLSDNNRVGEWQGLPVYRVSRGMFFVPAVMDSGAVIAKGEGREREFYFNEGEKIISIEEYEVSHADSAKDTFKVQMEGLMIKEERGSRYQDVLSEYRYYPRGVAESERRSFISGREVTDIPIEYGRDEWDNPVRVFQDIAQNHIDASPEGMRVELNYEVIRKGEKKWLAEDSLLPEDTITAIGFSDSGEGYAPSEIAILGASSKKSPLFAGKYGEGQKMVAAAALRNGLDLRYESVYTDPEGKTSMWTAQATPYTRQISLDGEEAERQFVSFEVESQNRNEAKIGSRTVFGLPDNPTPNQQEVWARWLETVDPRLEDKAKNKGLARYVRQLRPKDTQNSFSVGSVTILFDEPGAVYENGLRINSEAESGRGMIFGYDVPEIVTTRERNSYNSRRLEYYISHIIKNTKDPVAIKKILETALSSRTETGLKLYGLDHGGTAIGYWEEVARKQWPQKLIYSSRLLNEDINGDHHIWDSDDEERVQQKRKEALRTKANLVHFDENNLMDVPAGNYEVLSRILPTVEQAIEKLEHQTVEISEETREVLVRAVVNATRIFAELRERTADMSDHPFQRSYVEERIKKWSDYKKLLNDETAVGLAPIDAGFHGSADKGVILNEMLWISGNKRMIAEVLMHEMNHILADTDDYSEEFVEIMYDLARLLLERLDGELPEVDFGSAYIFDDENKGDYSRYEHDMEPGDEDWAMLDDSLIEN